MSTGRVRPSNPLLSLSRRIRSSVFVIGYLAAGFRHRLAKSGFSEPCRYSSPRSALRWESMQQTTPERVAELEQEVRDLKTALIFEKDVELASLQIDLIAKIETRIRQLKEQK